MTTAAPLSTELFSLLGVKLSDDQMQAFSDRVYNTLRNRVSTAIAQELNDQEVEEFMAINDDDQMTAWLAQHVPSYSDIIQDEFAILMGEIASDANKV